MEQEINKLIESGTIICGRIIKEEGIIRFERVDPKLLEEIPKEDRGYATASMGRAIFSIDNNGLIHNFKGVDSHLSLKELGPMDLVNAKAIEYIPNQDGYKISAVVFNDKKPEIRINGTSPLEDIEIEGDINKKLRRMGIKVPEIIYIREIPQDFSIKYGLPLKIDGDLKELNSDYAIEDDERKNRLKETYGSNYTQQLNPHQRPETMREYLKRIGFLDSEELKTNVESLGYSIDKFIKAVDNSYSRGQRYGQAERIVGSPFRISDLETCIANNNIEQLQAIFDFTEAQNLNFPSDLAKFYGKNIAQLINNGWECENLAHRQDFALSGEFCDDSYFDIFEKKREIKNKYSYDPGIIEASNGELIRKYTGQVMHIASSIKVVQDAMSLLNKPQKEIDKLLESFIDNFINNLNFKQIGDLFKIDEERAKNVFLKEFSPDQNWVEKMAKLEREEGIIMDEAIYNAHQNNNSLYSKISQMITNRIKGENSQTLENNDPNIENY